jgi:hypothetical protein
MQLSGTGLAQALDSIPSATKTNNSYKPETSWDEIILIRVIEKSCPTVLDQKEKWFSSHRQTHHLCWRDSRSPL